MLSKLDIVANYDLSHLRLIVVGAAPLAQETEAAVKERLRACNPGINLEVTQGTWVVTLLSVCCSVLYCYSSISKGRITLVRVKGRSKCIALSMYPLVISV